MLITNISPCVLRKTSRRLRSKRTAELETSRPGGQPRDVGGRYRRIVARRDYKTFSSLHYTKTTIKGDINICFFSLFFFFNF